MLTYTPLNFLGRLGNQLFEIFSVISEAKKINKSWLFPDWKYKNHINIPHEWFSHDVSGCIDMAGSYFQDWNNFENIKDLIFQIITPSSLIKKEINNLKNILIPENEDVEYIAIGIRRTDYLNNTNYYPLISLDYYYNGIDFIKKERSNKIIKIICFSDDIEWCKQNIKCDIYESNHPDSMVTLLLMSKCHHFIIANSTFHWWGAYLSTYNNKIVIYPIKWLGQGVPNKHTFNLFYPTWYGFTNSNGTPINFPNHINVNIWDAVNREDF
jgi:hypothetical protein